jgi:hypothetical protein
VSALAIVGLNDAVDDDALDELSLLSGGSALKPITRGLLQSYVRPNTAAPLRLKPRDYVVVVSTVWGGTCDAPSGVMRHPNPESGKAGYALAWLLGIPIPILLVVYAISRC